MRSQFSNPNLRWIPFIRLDPRYKYDLGGSIVARRPKQETPNANELLSGETKEISTVTKNWVILLVVAVAVWYFFFRGK